MTSHPRPAQLPIAVVGVSALVPGATDADGFWRLVMSGRDMITDVPQSHWLVEDYYDPDPAAPDKTYGRRGAFLPPVDFDPMAYGLPPNAMPATDSTQLLSLVVAEQVLKDAAGGNLDRLDRDRISVILGTAPLNLLSTMGNRLQRPVWLKALRESGVEESEAQAICDRIADHYTPWQEASFPGLLSNVVAGRIANRFDLHGTNCTTDAACASSLAALSAAASELALGTADMVVTGGVDTLNDILMYMCFSKTPALSPTGDCRPFAQDADGTILGEGLVMFALKRLADAERDGDQIYAVIKGVGTSSDGRSTAIYAPLPEGQARALRNAYQAAGYGPETVELVEAHGTGTKAGDVAEFASLRAVFEESGRTDGQWCAVGSIKSQIGHTKSAAGAAGLLKAVMALHHKVLPPTIKVEQPSAKLELETSPLYVNTQARPWVRDAVHPRRASVSSFGFGGSNFHLAVEEYIPQGGGRSAWRSRTAPSELVLLSADSPGELAQRCRSFDAGNRQLPAVARESQAQFRADAAARLSLVAADLHELAVKLASAADMVEKAPATPFTAPNGVSYASGAPQPGRVAFLFPGQGSQYVGMGADVAMHLPEAADAWDQAAGIELGEHPLHKVVFPVPAFTDEARAKQEARLTATEWAQPALAAHSLSLLNVLRAAGLRPDCVGGHSFGELVALHAAGAYGARTLVRLARTRGELMRDAAASMAGAMLAVRAARDTVEQFLARHAVRDVWIANHNAPGEVVVSGNAQSITELEAGLREAGVTARRLNAATAFHSPLVAAASGPIRQFLDSVAVDGPGIDVYGNADGALYPAQPETIRQRVADHLASQVRFVDQIEAMYASGVRTFVEVGAGSVLTNLVRQILGDRDHLAVALDQRGRDGVTSLNAAFGQLATRGVPMDLSALWTSFGPAQQEPETARKPRMTLQVSGAGYGKLYPPPGGASELPPPNLLAAPDPVEAVEVHPVVSAQIPEVEVPETTAITSLVLSVVAEKTGYPVEMLGTDLHLQADLGIDSIKRVEILSALRERAPELPDIDMEDLSTLGTLGQIIDRLDTLTIGQPAENAAPIAAAAPQVVPTASPAVAPAPAANSAATDEIKALVLEIVAEKTGYPVEMLGTDLHLQADLGIDSIKRVEILSALRERAPELPDIDMEELSALGTLGQIIDRLDAVTFDQPAQTTAISTESAPAPESAPIAQPERPTSDQQLDRRVVRAVPAPPSGYALPRLGDAPLAVTDDGSGVAEMVAAVLDTHGVRATVVRQVPADATGVIFLGGLRHVATADEAIAVNREAFEAARTVAARLQADGGVFVTVQDTGGDFGLSGSGDPDRAWLAGPAALARTAAKEWPAASVKAIDCERGARSAPVVALAIVKELLTGGSTLEVGLRADGTRIGLSDVAAPVEAAPAARIGRESVIVATGGARGVTATALLALAEAHRPRIVLFGRTPLTEEPAALSGITDEAAVSRALIDEARRQGGALPTPVELRKAVARVLDNREIKANLQALRRAGSTARYVAADVRDTSALRAALADVRQAWGPVTGIVHGAGVLADKHIAGKTDEQFAHVFDTKVAGLRSLLAATAEEPISVLCVFSSVAARYGNPGQSDYAMANEVLTQVASAQRRSRPDCVVRSIAWGPWRGGMVTPHLEAHFRQRGVPLIELDAGARAFVAELTGSGSDVAAVVTAPGETDPFGTTQSPRDLAEIRVNSRSHAYLADHDIAGTPVVPVAMALEWMAAAATESRPAGGPIALADINVYRKIALDRFGNGGHRLRVRGGHDEDSADSTRWLELVGDNDAPHYRASVAPGTAPADPSSWTVAVDPVDRAEIYDGHVLFHGPRFHAIRAVEGISAAGAAATVVGARERGWGEEHWRTDPLAVDGGLQLALLWAERALGHASLPMGIGEYRVHRSGLVDGPVRCVVRAREVRDTQAVCDIALIDADRSVRAELLGVNLVRRPS